MFLSCPEGPGYPLGLKRGARAWVSGFKLKLHTSGLEP